MDPVLTWPEGVTAAAAFTFDVDAESCVLAHVTTSLIAEMTRSGSSAWR